MEDLTERNPMELGKVELSTHCHGKPDGIELRDWFAGMALNGFIANKSTWSKPEDELSELSYSQADAMIKARGKEGQ